MEIPRASDKNIVQYEDDKNKTKLDTEPFVASNDICVDTLIQYIKSKNHYLMEMIYVRIVLFYNLSLISCLKSVAIMKCLSRSY